MINSLEANHFLLVLVDTEPAASASASALPDHWLMTPASMPLPAFTSFTPTSRGYPHPSYIGSCPKHAIHPAQE